MQGKGQVTTAAHGHKNRPGAPLAPGRDAAGRGASAHNDVYTRYGPVD
jgi:hypothetical protein